jgi:hypothetical protein
MRFATGLVTAAALALTFSAAPADAAIINLYANLDGLQETPPIATPATGNASITYDDVSNLLSWTITYSGLLGTANNAHFHGPATFGVSALPRVNIPFNSGVTSDVLVGSATISEAFEAELLNELWYINIHSTVHPGGEIRGQVIPEPGTLALLGLAMGALALRRRVRSS